MSTEKPPVEAAWSPERRPWGLVDLLAIAAWTAALAFFFRDALFFGKALFYFDITEINYPYRDFLAKSLRAGRFSTWHPGINNGLPLFAESQAGYLHPLKYFLYPWMSTWRALNLDTILSVWLTGLFTYGWLRRHVGPIGALTGAALFGLSGFEWAHLIHTSMANALMSVPLAFWGLEMAWDGGRLRGIALGALALACQVFAGHLQDTILTGGALGIYALCRAATAGSRTGRVKAIGFVALLGALGVAVAAVQWVPSKDLLDRSPREGGLTWEQITYGSWAPELLPTLAVREAYGTLARDTDWPDGYYPYHEMNAYLGLIGMALAFVGAGACRDRWVASWIVLGGLGAVFMLGRFTALFDHMNLVPVVGSSRIPVRYHLWVSLAVAALASVGVDRLASPGRFRLRSTAAFVLAMLAGSIVIATYVYFPAWTDSRRWTTPEHLEHFRWLGREVAIGVGRTLGLGLAAWWLIARAAKEVAARRRAWLIAPIPLLVMLDLLGSHVADVPTIDPSYWTIPPESARRIKADPSTIRVFGAAEKSAAEPGFASRPVDFFEVRDTLAWSLPPIWGLSSAMGHTPIYPRRMLIFHDHANPVLARYEVEGVTHLVTGRPVPGYPGDIQKAGSAYIHRLDGAQPRARLMGQPVYVADEAAASKALDDLGAAIRDRVIVEDPGRPLPEGAAVEGSARIAVDQDERVEVDVEARTPAYLVLADTYDTGWSATLDGQAAPIRPAFAGFRAVFVPKGSHRVIFTYEPAGLRTGLVLTAIGLIGVLACLAWPRPVAEPDPAHAPVSWPRTWPIWFGGLLLAFTLASAVKLGPGGPMLHPRWEGSLHRFTWSAGIDAIKPMSKYLGR
ncbi:YfhO family protein [Tundrisphaera lichenicola]|uniref:YfhO family protein n=1 Tax=Tundrisphaera lichenicola TaxID=2029860 RepID=UPI003EB9049B